MIRVLIVEDDVVTAAAHASYVDRTPGFQVAAIAHSAREALGAIGAKGADVDVVLLDLTLPDADGLDLARRMRAARNELDIIAITARRDVESVRGAVSVGATHYLIKPFEYSSLRDRLDQYAAYRERVSVSSGEATQHEVDQLLAARHSGFRAVLPKGLTTQTLDEVSAALRTGTKPLSASEVAQQLDVSRVTCRRYLEHLTSLGLVTRSHRHGVQGRPESTYVWAKNATP